LIKESIVEIKQALVNLNEILIKKSIKYTDVEIIGGGSRIPIV